MIDRDGAALIAQVAATLLVAVAVGSFFTGRLRRSTARRVRRTEELLAFNLLFLTMFATAAGAFPLFPRDIWTTVTISVSGFIAMGQFARLTAVTMYIRHERNE
ncbi:hypothetical protein [Rathayibacter sp. VKM Ac-2630]|uniref:hypothetical protein n=1 Tax=Rathayibacter sp. VKM Ac-2630 TaxID=1938617 RepID=UPI0011154E48|nr:hypothetical protein [Rathayibacter sp. VKM Ac-2630]